MVAKKASVEKPGAGTEIGTCTFGAGSLGAATSRKSAEIEKLRAGIDEMDMALLQLVAKRREMALEIAKLKQKTGPAEDEERIKKVLENVQARAKKLGLDEKEIKELWKLLIAYMIREQMKKYPY